MFIVLGSRGSLLGIFMSGSSSASSVSGSSFAAAFSVLNLAACLFISSLVCGCAGEKVGYLDWTGIGISSLSKNPPLVFLLVSSVVELDGG